jgi:hypothetical protein
MSRQARAAENFGVLTGVAIADVYAPRMLLTPQEIDGGAKVLDTVCANKAIKKQSIKI